MSTLTAMRRLFLIICLTFMPLLQGCGSSSDPSPMSMNSGGGCRPEDLKNGPVMKNLELAVNDNTGDTTSAKAWIAPGARHGIIFVTGIDGGFLEPADQIYTRTAESFYHQCVSSIFVTYRAPGNVPGNVKMSVADARSAIDHLKGLGINKMAIVGWSFGGAVISHTSAEVPEIATVIGFAPQGLYAEPIAQLRQSQSLLVFYSYDDENVAYTESQFLFDKAPGNIKKEAYPLSGYNHALDGTSRKIEPVFHNWLKDNLLN